MPSPRRNLRQDFFRPRAVAYHAIANPILRRAQGIKMRVSLPERWQAEGRPAVVGGPLLEGFHPIVPDNGYHNFLAAFRKRCNYFNSHRASPRVISCATQLIDELVPQPLPSFDWTAYAFEEWLLKFGPEKQARMRQAVTEFTTANVRDYSRKDIFVKCEALLVGHKPNWAPRVIYKGTDIYNAVSGPIFLELMSRLNGSYRRMSGPYRYQVAYRQGPAEFTPFLERCPGEFIECDFSANDMYQCADVMILELALMRRLGCPEWFCRLHALSGRFKVSSRSHGVSATLEHQLPTGATDTTFRNTFWNSCILHTFLTTVRADSCRALLLGDDMLARVVGLCRKAVATYVSIAKEARMVAKVARSRALVNHTFLSKCFVPIDGRHLTVPLIGKALGRFNMRANANHAVSDAAYFAGKSLGYAYEFRYFPVARDLFLQRFMKEMDVLSDEQRESFVVDGETMPLGWNAREAGLTLANARAKLLAEQAGGYWITEHHANAFFYYRYGFTFHEIMDLFSTVVLEVEQPDVGGVIAEVLAHDFL
jgi:hypothetical protein